jgi:hypothetical protein
MSKGDSSGTVIIINKMKRNNTRQRLCSRNGLNKKVHENELTFKMACNVTSLYLRVTYFATHGTKGNNITQKLNT